MSKVLTGVGKRASDILKCCIVLVQSFSYLCFQGVNLGVIVKDMRLSDDKKTVIHDILFALDKLSAAANVSPVPEDTQEPLTLFAAQCKVSVAHRVLANKHDAYSTLLKLLSKVQVSSNSWIILKYLNRCMNVAEFLWLFITPIDIFVVRIQKFNGLEDVWLQYTTVGENCCCQ